MKHVNCSIYIISIIVVKDDKIINLDAEIEMIIIIIYNEFR